MNLSYYKFLSIGLLKRKAVLIVGLLYLFFIFIFLILIPLITNINPLYIWSNNIVSPTNVLMYISALFSAIASIFIFKQYRDDGTELIIASKPLTRTTMIITKFVLYISFCLAFGLMASMLGWITLIFNQISAYQAFSLFISIFLANAIICLILGFVSVFVSLFLNRVWTILINIAVVILCAIYSIVNMLVTTTAASYLANHEHPIVTTSYANEKGEIKNAAFMTPKIDIDNETGILKDIYPINIEQTENIWEQAVRTHPTLTNNFFDFTHQFQLMNNMFGSQKYIQQNTNFGGDTWFDYKFDVNKKDSIPNSDQERPLFFVNNMPNWKDLEAIDTDFATNPLGFLEAMLLFFTTENINYLGDYHIASSSRMKFNFNGNSNYGMVGEATNGKVGMKNAIKKFTFNELKITSEQEEFFNKIIKGDGNKSGLLANAQAKNNIGLLTDSVIMNPAFNVYPNSVENNVWKNNINNSFTGNDPLDNINDATSWLHYVMLKNGYFNDNPRKILGINEKQDDPYGYTLAWLKFKLYCFGYCVNKINSIMEQSSYPSSIQCYENESWKEFIKWIINNPVLPDEIKKQITKIENIVSIPILPVEVTKDEWGNLPNINKNSTWVSPYFYNKEKWSEATPGSVNDKQCESAMIKALFGFITTKNFYGFQKTLDASNIKFYEKEQGQYGNYLYTNYFNFALGYESLLSKYTVTQKVDFWEIAIFWSLTTIVIGVIVIFIYWRVDFK